MSETNISCEYVAEIIRNFSRKGCLAEAGAIERVLMERGAAEDGWEEEPFDFVGLLNEAIESEKDLEVIRDPENQAFYYSTDTMSRTYARIVVRKGVPLQLMAETIREHSAKYPRPVPLDLFEQGPFDLTAEVIQSSLQAMADSEQYKDIAYTTTSEGSIYLYSTDSLDHDYAEFLAEREDVDLMTDP